MTGILYSDIQYSEIQGIDTSPLQCYSATVRKIIGHEMKEKGIFKYI